MKKPYFAAAFLLFLCLPSTAEAPKLTVRLAAEVWEPFNSPALPDGGLFSEICTESFRRAGSSCTIDFVPWNRALTLAKEGKYDGVIGGFYQKEREQYFIYSEPLTSVQIVLYSRADETIEFSKLHDLKKYQIGTILGYHYTDEFDNASYLLKIPSAGTEDNIRLLANHRIDVMIDVQDVVSYLLRTKSRKYYSTLKKISPPLAENRLYILFSRKTRAANRTASDFQRGLDAIKADGTFNAILQKHREIAD